jgi:hypothetical protein
MRPAKIAIGSLAIIAGLATIGLEVSIARQPNGDEYGLVFGLQSVALGLLSVVIGVLILLWGKRR